ncbi:MAG: hypothetical protein HFI05_00240 [Lachnospiraceae bacterium]|jgi:hypothetical protein|nr:hypothetical protein [Lachnospiraceae bacterium]
MTNKEKILLELQILTETITDDIDYMVFLLLKDGLYFKQDTIENNQKVDELESINIVQGYEEWFKTL